MKHATSTLPEPLTPANEAGTPSAPGRAAAASPSVLPAFDGLADLAGYQRDAFERWVLYLDALRRRGDAMLEHERAGMPPLLDFRYETVLDARRFERPANYALLRIVEIGDDCWDDCVDPAKPPVIVIDPRAGHGPGIGGFKRDSEVGMALHEGHPVYFVSFFPDPAPHQTLADVHFALRRFVEKVAELHPGTPPVLYGNCQAGWAATLLAADCEGTAGPVVLNGSPLSYWAGEPGSNPMRVMGALSGGAWLAHLTADLAGGRMDGAWLAQNFENLQPEKAIWEKHANLFANVDEETERFLDFERWWTGFYFLSREEILAITENLFVGNRLERGTMRISDDCVVDLRRIRSPLVIFASWGDNITPPYQALGWIPVVYESTEDLKAAGQRIVYMTNPHVGHLGIFVSAGVARLEHRAILENLDRIEALEPGLYEMTVENPTGDPDCAGPDLTVRFEPRRVEDLPPAQTGKAFERAERASTLNETVYRSAISPWVKAMSTPWLAEALKWMHPMRTRRHMFATAFNPWMQAVAAMADTIRETRAPLPSDHPLRERERLTLQAVGKGIETARVGRDSALAGMFTSLYGVRPERETTHE